MADHQRAEAKQMIDEMREAIAQARRRFRASVSATLTYAEQLAETFEPAIGEIDSDTALDAWRKELRRALGGH